MNFKSSNSANQMNPKYSVVVVHGINGNSGETQSGFSKPLADLVIPDKSLQDKFWHEAVWEGVCDDFDKEVGKIITNLVASYNFEEHFKRRLTTEKATKKFLAAISYLSTLLAKEYLSEFFSAILDYALDLPLYLGDAYGNQIRKIVRKAIQEASGRTNGVVVVGHSLGSVIAYDVIARLLTKPNPPVIHGFITMGSPLGWVIELRKQIKKWASCPSLPESVNWVNFYNSVDPVPLKQPLSKTEFPGVKNLALLVQTKNPIKAHSSYWKDPRVVEQIKRLCS